MPSGTNSTPPRGGGSLYKPPTLEEYRRLPDDHFPEPADPDEPRPLTVADFWLGTFRSAAHRRAQLKFTHFKPSEW